MSGLTYAEGHFPFCVPTAAGVWDGSTFWTSGLLNIPSTTTSALNLAVGPGTRYPIGMTLEQMSALYWRIAAWKFTANMEHPATGSYIGGSDAANNQTPFPIDLDTTNNNQLPWQDNQWNPIVYAFPWTASGLDDKIHAQKACHGAVDLVWSNPTPFYATSTTSPFVEGSTIQVRMRMFDSNNLYVPAMRDGQTYYPYLEISTIYGLEWSGGSGTGFFVLDAFEDNRSSNNLSVDVTSGVGFDQYPAGDVASLSYRASGSSVTGGEVRIKLPLDDATTTAALYYISPLAPVTGYIEIEPLSYFPMGGRYSSTSGLPN